MGEVCFYIPIKLVNYSYSNIVKEFKECFDCQEKQVELLKTIFDTITNVKKKCTLLVSFYEECFKKKDVDVVHYDDDDFDEDEDVNDISNTNNILYFFTKQQVSKYLKGVVCEEFLTRYLQLISHTFKVNSNFLLSIVLLHIIHYTDTYNIPKMETFIQTLLLNIHPKNIK
jgi:hypothetical protein